MVLGFYNHFITRRCFLRKIVTLIQADYRIPGIGHRAGGKEVAVVIEDVAHAIHRCQTIGGIVETLGGVAVSGQCGGGAFRLPPGFRETRACLIANLWARLNWAQQGKARGTALNSNCH